MEPFIFLIVAALSACFGAIIVVAFQHVTAKDNEVAELREELETCRRRIADAKAALDGKEVYEDEEE